MSYDGTTPGNILDITGINILGKLPDTHSLPDEGNYGEAYVIDGELYNYVGRYGNVKYSPNWHMIEYIHEGPGNCKNLIKFKESKYADKWK